MSSNAAFSMYYPHFTRALRAAQHRIQPVASELSTTLTMLERLKPHGHPVINVNFWSNFCSVAQWARPKFGASESLQYFGYLPEVSLRDWSDNAAFVVAGANPIIRIRDGVAAARTLEEFAGFQKPSVGQELRAAAAGIRSASDAALMQVIDEFGIVEVPICEQVRSQLRSGVLAHYFGCLSYAKAAERPTENKVEKMLETLATSHNAPSLASY
jgi:hypothetical protein